MKKIVFFTGGDDLYGANKVLFNTIALYDKYERYVCLPNRGKLSELLENTYRDIKIITLPNLPVIAKKYLNFAGIIKFLNNLLISKNSLRSILSDASIIYLNTFAVLPVSLYSKKYTILHVHEILGNNSIMNRMVNIIGIKRAQKVICVSKATLTNLKQVCDQSSLQKLVTIHNGISPITMYEEKNTSNKCKVKLVLLGRIKPIIKGQNYVIDALKLMPDELKSKIHISFVGSPVPGEEKDLINLEERILNEKLTEIISIIPFTEDISQIYKDADICLVPSVRADPFPTTVLEAMSAKRPVIGTELGGIPEMIENNITGYVISPNNPEEFAKRIRELVENKNLRLAMGQKGYEKYVNNYTLKSYACRYKAELGI